MTFVLVYRLTPSIRPFMKSFGCFIFVSLYTYANSWVINVEGFHINAYINLHTLESRNVARIYDTIMHTAHSTIISIIAFRLRFALTNDTPCFVFAGELWGVVRESYREKIVFYWYDIIFNRSTTSPRFKLNVSSQDGPAHLLPAWRRQPTGGVPMLVYLSPTHIVLIHRAIPSRPKNITHLMKNIPAKQTDQCQG